MTYRERLPVERFDCDAGHATIAMLGSNAILITMSGRLDSMIGRRLSMALQGLMDGSRKPVHTFWDLEHLEHYHSDVRILCTQALVRNMSLVKSVRVLAKSRIVKMGVAVANIALGGRIHSAGDRAEFEGILRGTLG